MNPNKMRHHYESDKSSQLFSQLSQSQTRAIEKVVERCADSEKKTGLMWYTQGSGKTFTMITVARQLLENKEIFSKATDFL